MQAVQPNAQASSDKGNNGFPFLNVVLESG